MQAGKGAIAAAAASLFLGATGVVALAGAAGAEEKIKCEGVNSCKGSSSCKTFFSSCAGHNECKGKGFLMLTPEECEAARAEMARDEGEK
ncbi:MAG: hypothetical protein ACQGVK_25605 [Myxococcota bacterium]